MTKRSAKVSHLQGILEMPGFKGFPTGGNYESGYATTQELPQPDIPSSRIAEKFSNGRRAYGHLPLHEEDVKPRINAISKDFLMYGFKQSKPSSETHKANCAETAMIPNENPIPFYHDLADAQATAQKQVDSAHATMTDDMGKRFPSIHELKEKHGVLFKGGRRHKKMSDNVKPPQDYYDAVGSKEKEGIEQFFADYNRVREEQMLVDLINKGYTEDEVAEYFKKKRISDIEKDAMTPSGMARVESAIMAMRTPPTHTNASGITPQNANQLQSISMMSKPSKKTAFVEGSSPRDEAYPLAGKLDQPSDRVTAVHNVQLSERGRKSFARGSRRGMAKTNVAISSEEWEQMGKYSKEEQTEARKIGYRRAVAEGRVGRPTDEMRAMARPPSTPPTLKGLNLFYKK